MKQTMLKSDSMSVSSVLAIPRSDLFPRRLLQMGVHAQAVAVCDKLTSRPIVIF